MKQIGEASTTHILKTILKQLVKLNGVIFNITTGDDPPVVVTTPVTNINDNSDIIYSTTYHVDTSANEIAVTLPLAIQGNAVNIKKISEDGNPIRVLPRNGALIQGATELLITDQWDTVTLYDDGVNWFIR